MYPWMAHLYCIWNDLHFTNKACLPRVENETAEEILLPPIYLQWIDYARITWMGYINRTRVASLASQFSLFSNMDFQEMCVLTTTIQYRCQHLISEMPINADQYVHSKQFKQRETQQRKPLKSSLLLPTVTQETKRGIMLCLNTVFKDSRKHAFCANCWIFRVIGS